MSKRFSLLGCKATTLLCTILWAGLVTSPILAQAPIQDPAVPEPVSRSEPVPHTESAPRIEPDASNATEARIGSTVVVTPGIDAQLTPATAAPDGSLPDADAAPEEGGDDLALSTDHMTDSGFDQQELYRFVSQGMDLWNIPGMAVTVVSKDQVLFRQGFGKTSTARDGMVVDEHTLFAAASTTKAMVVAGLLILQDEGKLSLSDPVTQHLPELQFGDPMLNRELTVTDLLAHRTGLPSTDLWTFMQGMPLEEQLDRLRHVQPEASLRSRLIYQNTMYEIAGLLIERLSGERWDSFLMHRLWHPIGMREMIWSRLTGISQQSWLMLRDQSGPRCTIWVFGPSSCCARALRLLVSA